MKARQQIALLFETKKQTSVAQIVRETGFSKQLVHRILLDFIALNKIEKRGLPPKTIYCKKEIEIANIIEEPLVEFKTKDTILANEFLLISATGEYITGEKAFANWCLKRKLPIAKTWAEYKTTLKKYAQYYLPNGLIDGTDKLKKTVGFSHIFIDSLHYLDFYAIERFGKTKLGTLLHFAKQGQNKFLMLKILNEIKTKVEQFIKEQQIEAIIFVPPTVKREVQIMTFLRENLHFGLPQINVMKINNQIAIPQKSLNKLDERIANADYSFMVYDSKPYKNILMIDDAVGSGATLNQIAKKIREKNLAQKIICLAIVGSFKGFDVITDV